MLELAAEAGAVIKITQLKPSNNGLSNNTLNIEGNRKNIDARHSYYSGAKFILRHC